MTYKEILLFGIGHAALNAALTFAWFKLGVGDVVGAAIVSILFK